jgi:hypothetical protein
MDHKLCWNRNASNMKQKENSYTYENLKKCLRKIKGTLKKEANL